MTDRQKGKLIFACLVAGVLVAGCCELPCNEKPDARPNVTWLTEEEEAEQLSAPNVCEDTFYSIAGIALMSPVESYAIKNADKIREIEAELMEHSKTCPRCCHYIQTGEVDESLKIVKRETSIFDGLEE